MRSTIRSQRSQPTYCMGSLGCQFSEGILATHCSTPIDSDLKCLRKKLFSSPFRLAIEDRTKALGCVGAGVHTAHVASGYQRCDSCWLFLRSHALRTGRFILGQPGDGAAPFEWHCYRSVSEQHEGRTSAAIFRGSQIVVQSTPFGFIGSPDRPSRFVVRACAPRSRRSGSIACVDSLSQARCGTDGPISQHGVANSFPLAGGFACGNSRSRRQIAVYSDGPRSVVPRQKI